LIELKVVTKCLKKTYYFSLFYSQTDREARISNTHEATN